MENGKTEYKLKIHPLNVKGKYFVDQDDCLVCECCYYFAPNNFKMDENYCAYVFKQPETAEEDQECKNAMDACPVEAIHNDGE